MVGGGGAEQSWVTIERGWCAPTDGASPVTRDLAVWGRLGLGGGELQTEEVNPCAWERRSRGRASRAVRRRGGGGRKRG